jgi:tRNA-splicing ligase RtcB
MAIPINQIDETTWEIPRSGAMRVPGRILADARLMEKIRADKTAEQVANVACLPGIVGYAWAMPDAHWGYGFPIGGVAATDPDQEGVVSPGGVGYDINCGVRVMTTRLAEKDVLPHLETVMQKLYDAIPSGVGSSGAIRRLGDDDMTAVLQRGAAWAIEQGMGEEEDLATCEEHGALPGADVDAVSDKARERGRGQLGTLGSGNHFCEVGIVDRVFDREAAEVFELVEGRLTVMIHSGSRGFGYQTCDDALVQMQRAMSRYGISLPDRQLACVPVHSHEGRGYLGAMAAAANYAWTNRQVMMHLARGALAEGLGAGRDDIGGRLLYDVCHNIAKMEVHEVAGGRRRLCVHRKGATRAFPGSREEVPEAYRGVGQPVLVPGDMGTGTYVCVGTEKGLAGAFGSSCHGAGRALSRKQATKQTDYDNLLQQLKDKGIVVKARSKRNFTEEAPAAYKNIDAVAEVIERSGTGRRVARIRPIGVVKG